MDTNGDLILRNGSVTVVFDRSTGLASIETDGTRWTQDAGFPPKFTRSGPDGKPVAIPFSQAASIEWRRVRRGPYDGVETDYRDFRSAGVEEDVAFRTFTWIGAATSDVHFEWIPLAESKFSMREVHWPPPLRSDAAPGAGYAVLPTTQGQLIRDGDEVALERAFRVYARAQTMPWFGQATREDGPGYLALIGTPFDAIVHYRHEAAVPGAPGRTAVHAIWSDSLGRMDHRRELTVRCCARTGYVAMCREFRRELEAKGELTTLRQKALVRPQVAALAGIPAIHTGALYHTEPASHYFNKEDPSKNDTLTTFDEIASRMEKLSALGVRKAYVHIDGWGKRGYDNLHPDILPPCEAAGGLDGFRDMLRRIRAAGFIPAVHDQYWDYYADGETFSEDLAVRTADGRVVSKAYWAGGEQRYLCAVPAVHYLERNYDWLDAHGALPDGAYLDCISSNEFDECDHPAHRMTRAECAALRAGMLCHVRGRDMIVSSEEPSGHFVPFMDLVHHGPWYHAEWLPDKGQKFGTPVPLFNLVYHDCLIIPWTTGMAGFGVPPGDATYLHALLNGGMPYLSETADAKEIARIGVFLRLHEKVAFCEMSSHAFVEGDLRVQRTEFSDGTKVTADFDNLTWRIDWADGAVEEGKAEF